MLFRSLRGERRTRMLELRIEGVDQRSIEAVDSQSPVAIREGECTVTGRSNHYFGSNALLAKFYAGTPTSLNSRLEKDSQALIFQFPRITFRGDGNPSAQPEGVPVSTTSPGSKS